MPFRPRLFAAHAPIAASTRNPHSSVSILYLPNIRAPCRAFHASCRRLAVVQNHYERLRVRYDAPPAEIKKSFYALSKTYHPDVNRDNPDAANTFSQISEAYHVLSNETRRAAYDRDVLRLHHHGASAAPGHKGSYHSSNPAGGRTPSGLSRRRTTFRGPPPSFYRSGGWGAHAGKRQQAHEETTGTGPAGAASEQQSTDQGGPGSSPFGQYGGMGPGEDPFGHRDDVPHFDKESHTKTHERQDQRRWQRQRRALDEDDTEFEPQTSLAAHFVIVSAILATAVLAPMMYLQFMRSGRKKKESNA